MAITIISANQVKELLPMEACIPQIEKAMIALSRRELVLPQRQVIDLGRENKLLIMPSASSQLGRYGSKIINIHPHNKNNDLPVIQGFFSIFDLANGRLLSIIDGSSLTAIRTAAASALATKLLARENSHCCGIFGTGVQASSHIDAMIAVRPITTIKIWARDFSKAIKFAAQEKQRTGKDCHAYESPIEVANSDIVCTVTGAIEPILKGQWLQSGSHINLVGAHSPNSREADTLCVQKSKIYVDCLTATFSEGGDIIIPLAEEAINREHIIGELGQLAEGEIIGRQSKGEITLYKSLGIAAQDLYSANYIYQQANKKGMANEVEF